MDYRETNRRLIPAFRSGAPLPGMHRERLLLLTTTGRRSGRPHTTPMMFHRQDGRMFVIASNVGAPRDPEWCLNLRADPRVTVEVGDRDPGDPGDDGRPGYAATASVLRGDERAVVWRRIIELYPFFDHHQKGAAPREIPVVELTRV
jgi:deazaflavin-dependent oxidoreductase (nitroreductase family)